MTAGFRWWLTRRLPLSKSSQTSTSFAAWSIWPTTILVLVLV